jgi:hypothetical protein
MKLERFQKRASIPPVEQQEWVRRYRQGHLGLRRFAEVHGLRYSQLHYWIYGGRDSNPSEAPGLPPDSQPVFREVQWIRPSPSQPESGWDAEIAWPDGTRLCVRRDIDPAWIASLAQAIRRPC